MCLLALLFRVMPDAPVIAGANREERTRGGDPPRVLDGRVLAGTDPVAGGTWFGVNEHGVLIAVTNRPKSSRRPIPAAGGSSPGIFLRVRQRRRRRSSRLES